MSTSISAYADTGQNFYAKITTGTGEFEVYLYKDGREIDRCVGITSPTWLRFYDIPEDSSDYYLKIAVTGSSKATYIISGTLHDHGDPE